MSTPSTDNTVSLALTPITSGSIPPNIATDAFHSNIEGAKAGGAATQAYFDAINQTADYWSWLTETVKSGGEGWAEAQDPEGHPILISSNGNMEVRMGAFYRAPAAGDGHVAAKEGDAPPITGLATIQTHNTTTGIASDISFGLALTGLPPGVVLSGKLFTDLIKPVYNNLKVGVNKIADKFRESAEVEDPSIDPLSEAEGPIEDASAEIEDVAGELAAEGAEYAAIEWTSVAGEVAGLGVLAAIPLIVSFLGHKMVNSVMIENLTDTDFTWSLDQEHGTASVLPDPKLNNKIPKMDRNTDSWGDKTTVKVAYEARMQMINVNDFGSIGWVIGLTPSDGGAKIATVVDIPWAGNNTNWSGAFDKTADQLWAAHTAVSDEQLSVTSTVGKYKVTSSITALRGEKDGAYFYGTLIVIEPA